MSRDGVRDSAWPSRNVSFGAASCQCFIPCHMSLGVPSARVPATHPFWHTRSTLQLACGGGGLAPGDSDCPVMGRPRVARAKDVFLETPFFQFSKVQLLTLPVTDPDLVITGATVSADSKQDHPFLWMTLKKLKSGCVWHTLSCHHDGKALSSGCRRAEGAGQ